MWTGQRVEKEQNGRTYSGLLQEGEDLQFAMHIEDRYTAPMFRLLAKLDPLDRRTYLLLLLPAFQCSDFVDPAFLVDHGYILCIPWE
jgi:hypothetical protein